MNLTNICFDIETVRAYDKLSEAPADFQTAWSNFAIKRWPGDAISDEHIADLFTLHGGLFPEFGKIVCISTKVKGYGVKSFWLDSKVPANDREKAMLTQFAEYIKPFGHFRFVGHNIKRFDIPFIIIRFVANGMALPPGFRMYGVKPWEMSHWDTMEIWTQGVFGSSQSKALETVCMVLGIESPKADFSGAEVATVFYSGKPDSMERIVKYCERDVLGTATGLLAMFKFGMVVEDEAKPYKKKW